MQNETVQAAATGYHLVPTEYPKVSVVICTRNRGGSVQAAIQSVFANEHSNFELIVVDQSTNDFTEETVQPFIKDSRFRYIRSHTIGVGLSRNIGLKSAKADIIIYTDDDCTVSTHWLNAFENVFWKYPQVTIVFCSVDPAPYAHREGSIPYRHYSKDKIYRSIIQYFDSYGMGAGMGLRKSAVLKWGGFDETLGPGAYFRSGEDIDIALRTLLNHGWVYELASESVIHHGFRSRVEFREISKRDFYAIGAVHSKLAKRSLMKALPAILYSSLYISLCVPMAMAFSFKRPSGLTRFGYYWMGFFKGMKTPVDNSDLVYLYQS